MKKAALILSILFVFSACSEDQQQATPPPPTPTATDGGPVGTPGVVVTTAQPDDQPASAAVATPVASSAPGATAGPTAGPGATAAPGTTAAPATAVPASCTDLRGGDFATIAMTTNAYEPSCAIVDLDQGLTLSNYANTTRNFSVRGTRIDLDVAPNGTLSTEDIRGAIPKGRRTIFDKRNQQIVGVLEVVD